MLGDDTRYRVIEVLKAGESETTERVEPEQGDAAPTPLVRKRIKLSSGLGAVYRELFDAQAAGQAFAHLPRIFSCAEDGDELFVVMELVEGQTLQDVVYYRDPSPELAANVFGDVCDAVIELHASLEVPIIHRDLKPSNIIINERGVFLIDFGIARAYKSDAQGDTVRFGTRGYAPPEQFGYGQTDVRSDVYALGMVLYYCLTEQNADASERKECFADRRIPEQFRDVLVKATEFDPDARYASVAQLKKAFAVAVDAWKRESGGGEAPLVAPDPASRIVDAKAEEGPDGYRATPEASTASTVPPSDLAAQSQHARNGLFTRVPTGIGVAWNAFLGVVGVIWLVFCTAAAFAPAGSDETWPLAYALYAVVGVFGMPGALLCFVLFDKRRLRGRFPKLEWLTLGKGLMLWLVLFLALLIIAIVIYSAFFSVWQ